MKVLVIGGTGLISAGILKHLLRRGAQVTLFNRGRRAPEQTPNVRSLLGDRTRFADFERQFQAERFDAVIDMICFNAEQAESDLRAFAGRCEHFLFCSTVLTYGYTKETGPPLPECTAQAPFTNYARNKRACERVFRRAHEQGLFHATIVRPSTTYGPGSALVDQLELNPVAWDRIERGRPVLAASDGQVLTQATHRDDCGKFFAYAALNAKTYGQDYNVTCEESYSWRAYYRHAAAALGRTARLVFLPSETIIQKDADRFVFLKNVTRYHGVFDSSKARRDVPEFTCEIGLQAGMAEVLADARRRTAWRDSANDLLYDTLVQRALNAGSEPVQA